MCHYTYANNNANYGAANRGSGNITVTHYRENFEICRI